MNLPPSPFWEYSVSLFQDEPVAIACLALQERHVARVDVDVNILLLCVWAAAYGHGELDDQDFLRAISAVTPWRRDILLPLRGAARQLLGDGIEPVPEELTGDLRQKITHAELEAERIEQLLLVQLVGPAPLSLESDPSRAENAATNFARYFARIGLAPSTEDAADLAAILERAFPEEAAGTAPVDA
jgi:uncharacterized protein (TIGR02444 family)